MKQYAGAYVDGFEWPQPNLHSDDDNAEETEGAFAAEECKLSSHEWCDTTTTSLFLFFFNVPEMECPSGGPPEAVLIDSLLSVDQYRGADKSTSSDSDEKPARDIAEVAAATELILPKGSFRTTSPVKTDGHIYTQKEKVPRYHFIN